MSRGKGEGKWENRKKRQLAALSSIVYMCVEDDEVAEVRGPLEGSSVGVVVVLAWLFRFG